MSPHLSVLDAGETRRKPSGPEFRSHWVKIPEIRALAIVVTFATAASLLAHGAASQTVSTLKAQATETVSREELLWWLPADTESVVAARGPFLLPADTSRKDADNSEEPPDKPVMASEIRRSFQSLPFELFEQFDLGDILRGATVAYALQGSRHFRDPLPDFDVMEFEGCSIIVLLKPLGKRGDSLVQALAKKAIRTDTLAGTRIFVFHEKSEHAEWDHFFALPRPDVLLAANNLDYLRQVLERMGRRIGPRAMPEQLPEWKYLDPDTQFWGVRHYDPSQAKLDPTSPFSKERTFGPGDRKAIGYLFALDPTNPRTVLIFYLTADEAKVRESAAKGSIVHQPEEGVKYVGKLQSPAPGVLQSTYKLNQRITLDYLLLTVEMALGRGMYF